MSLALRLARSLLGALFIYLAIFLHEDEEGRIQNRLTIWDQSLTVRRDKSLSAAAALMSGVALLTGRAFDRLLGRKLLSPRAAGVSFCYSMASFFLLVIVSVPMLHLLKNQPTVPVFRAWLWFIFFFFLGTIPGLVDPRAKETLPIWGLSVFVSICGPLALVADVVAWKFGRSALIRLLCFIVLLFGISFGSDIFYIALTRWMLRQASRARRVYRIAGLILLDCALGLLLFLGPIFLGLFLFAKFHGLMSGGLMFGFALNFVDVVACSAFLIVLLTMLSHRLMWPILQRPVSACARFEVIKKHKKMLWLIGITLILAPKGAWAWLSALLEKLG